MKFFHRSTIVLVMILGLGAFSGSGLLAQEVDLGIPGLEEETKPPPAAAAGPGAATASEQNLLDMILQGGWAMFPLAAFSLAVIGLFIYCLIDLQKRNFCPDQVIQGLKPHMETGDLETASRALQPRENCISAVMAAGFVEIGDRGFEELHAGENLAEAMTAASRKFSRGRVRLINWFSVLAQASPMVGLLGTVSGMIGAFGVLARGGGGDPSIFAGDISEALITTASGLVIALPAIFSYFLFRDRLQQLVAESDEEASALIRTLRRSVIAVHGDDEHAEH